MNKTLQLLILMCFLHLQLNAQCNTAINLDITINSSTEASFTWGSAPPTGTPNGIPFIYNWELYLGIDETSTLLNSGSVLESNPLSTDFNSLTPGENYFVRINTGCVNTFGSVWVGISFTMPCIPPTSVSVSNIVPAAADFSWSNNFGVNHDWMIVNSWDDFNTDWNTDNNTTSNPEQIVQQANNWSGTSVNDYVNSLIPLSAYYFYVRSNCSDGITTTSWARSPLFVTTCSNPEAVQAVVEDCSNNQFYIDVNISDLESSTMVTVKNDAGAPSIPAITSVGIVQIGPFTSGTPVNVTLESNYGSSCDTSLPTITFDCGTLNTVDVVSQSNFIFYPNPVQSHVILNAEEEIDQISMFNVLGKHVLTTFPNEKITVIDLSIYKSGIYFLNIAIGPKRETVKIIKY